MFTKRIYFLIIGLVIVGLTSCSSSSTEKELTSTDNPLVKVALTKTKMLKAQMEKARLKNIDVTREETVLWFAKEFLKYADWDENNQDAVTYLFGEYHIYKKDKEKYAAEIPDFERKMVVQILDDGIKELTKVLENKIKRRPVNKVDWQNIEVGDNVLLSNGKPIFLYDYFSKTVGQPLTNTAIYNDHLGAIYHGGEKLYKPEHDRAINSFLLKEDRTLDETQLKRVTDISDKNVGFLIYWNQGIPEWVAKQEPEARMGRSTFTGFDIDNPLVRELWGTIASKTGAITKGKKVTQLGYILANEPHWHSISSGWTKRTGEMQNISSYTLNKFRNWLNAKYDGDLNALNKNWSTKFTSFDTIEIKIPFTNKNVVGTPIYYDWARYNMDRAIDWYSYLQGELRKGNPEADTHIKQSTHHFTGNGRAHGIDLETLTELTSMIGDDAKAGETRSTRSKKPEEWEEHYAYSWGELGMSYDFMESVSPEKIHVNSESHFLSSVSFRKLDTSVEYVESIHWLATLLGMDVNLTWFWARDPDGSPEGRLEGKLEFSDKALAGSFAGSINQQPQIANAYTQVMYDLNAFSEEIIELRKQRRPLRLFYSETSAINKKNHMTEQFSMYEKVFFDGFPVGFATEKIIEKQDNSLWDVILVYKTEFVTIAELDALQSYLDNGGTVIVDNVSLSKNEYGQPHTKHLSAIKGKLIRLKTDETRDEIRKLVLKETEKSRSAVTLVEDNGTDHQGVHWRVVQQKNGKYLISILNIGKDTANITLGIKNISNFNVTNLLTQEAMNAKFKMAPKGVLLLELEPR
ncbi:beta-galactosidase [Polaribacter sp. Z014]|uniref:beta-galactosidase n=1 Tax=Polaribacter sp. Z014 TaxID=2927126 RepID=UPI002020A5BE|nr:beta-galactosidase [Polaribacter sp. Z014]MCL7764373.1 beta-galactosidase [Polaribacter sp. Z014]